MSDAAGAESGAGGADAFADGQPVSDVFQPGYGETAGLIAQLEKSFDPHATVFSYEMNRIGQALRAAGIDPAILTPMSRAVVLRALNTDSTLFEESGAGLSLFYQTHALRDAVSETEQERAQREGRLPGSASDTAPSTTQPAPSPEQKQYWEGFQHNLGFAVLGIGGLVAAGASRADIAREYEAYRDMTPDYPGVIERIKPPQTMAQQVTKGVQDASKDILQNMQDRVNNINLDDFKPRGLQVGNVKSDSWVNYVEGRDPGLPSPGHTPAVPGFSKKGQSPDFP